MIEKSQREETAQVFADLEQDEAESETIAEQTAETGEHPTDMVCLSTVAEKIKRQRSRSTGRLTGF